MIFMLQLGFQFFRVLSTRTIIAKHVTYTLLNTVAIQALWLITTYYGVIAMMNTDWWLISGYMVGGVLGTLLSLTAVKQIKGER